MMGKGKSRGKMNCKLERNQHSTALMKGRRYLKRRKEGKYMQS
jgi:hypothetical protein